MEEKRMTFKELKFKLKVKEGLDKVKETGKKALNWALENPVMTAAILGTTTTAVNKLYRVHRDHTDEVHRNRRFYDPRKGRYSEARRNLRKYELEEIEDRYENGESYRSILSDMKLLR